MYNLLIVDDEKQSREVIIYLLDKNNINFNVIQASNGKEALEILKQQSIDILFTDVKMPFLNGIELASQTRKLYFEIPILFFSGYDDFDYLKKAMSLDVIDYILKPIDTNEFYKSVNQIIQKLNSTNIDNIGVSTYIDEKLSTNENVLENNDSFSLDNITNAINHKNSDLLISSVNEILNSYEGREDISHIYIKYLCTNILHIIMKSIPTVDENEVKVITDEVFNMKKISNIFDLIKHYMDKLINVYESDNKVSNVAISNVCQYIQANYDKDLSLQILADLIYLNPKYLSRVFVQETGVTLNKYIKNLRFEKAENLLLTTNKKIADVSKAVGYSNVSYFCKVFHTEYNVTPETFRQNGGNHDC